MAGRGSEKMPPSMRAAGEFDLRQDRPAGGSKEKGNFMGWLPGWNTVSAADWWESFWFWGSVVALILLGMAQVISHRYGIRRDELAAEQRRQTDQAHEQTVADLHDQASRADEKAAMAGKEAAEFGKEAAEFGKAAAEARLETEKLRRTFQWREITTATANDLIATLAVRKGSVNIRYIDGDPESLSFAQQIGYTLSDAGWNVSAGGIKLENVLVGGLYLPDDDSPDAAALRHAFAIAKVPYATDRLSARTVDMAATTIPGAPLLLVGSKVTQPPWYSKR
jgi:hypothetical protein